jgi:hypothetical protein
MSSIGIVSISASLHVVTKQLKPSCPVTHDDSIRASGVSNK